MWESDPAMDFGPHEARAGALRRGASEPNTWDPSRPAPQECFNKGQRASILRSRKRGAAISNP
eukprot:10556780-Alexandrium_andersonii.AAC.1